MSKLTIVPRSKRSRQYKAPTYEIIHTMTGFWVGRCDGDVFQLVEKFEDFESAEDFMGFCAEAAAQARRRLASH